MSDRASQSVTNRSPPPEEGVGGAKLCLGALAPIFSPRTIFLSTFSVTLTAFRQEGEKVGKRCGLHWRQRPTKLGHRERKPIYRGACDAQSASWGALLKSLYARQRRPNALEREVGGVRGHLQVTFREHSGDPQIISARNNNSNTTIKEKTIHRLIDVCGHVCDIMCTHLSAGKPTMRMILPPAV